MRRGHIPERTCRGCGRKAPRAELERFVVIDGALIEDRQDNMPGRGIYCCNHIACRQRLAKRVRVRKAD